MKKIILILATILCFFGVTKAQQQQTITGNVVSGYFPIGGGNTSHAIFTSPLKITTVPTATNNIFSGKKVLNYNAIIAIGENKAGTGSLTAGSSIYSVAKNLNICADTNILGYSTNILYRGKNVFKSALSVASNSAASTSTLNLMSDSGIVAIGYKLRANKLPLNDSSGLSKGDFYISGNTIKVKR